MELLTDIWGEPFNYKDILIYPIKMKDCINFYNSVNCLLLEKNKIPDVQVIKMSYLAFLFALSKQYKNILKLLDNLLYLVLRDQTFKFSYDYNHKFYLVINKDIEINGEMVNRDIFLDEKDFENIRKIILKQNLIKFDNELMDEEVKRALEEAQEFMSGKNKSSQANLEELITAYHCAMGYEYKKIKELTIYQFNKGIQRKALMINFEVLGTALATGMVKGDIPNWLEHIEEKGIYDDVIMSEEEFNKITADKDIFAR